MTRPLAAIPDHLLAGVSRAGYSLRVLAEDLARRPYRAGRKEANRPTMRQKRPPGSDCGPIAASARLHLVQAEDPRVAPALATDNPSSARNRGGVDMLCHALGSRPDLCSRSPRIRTGGGREGRPECATPPRSPRAGLSRRLSHFTYGNPDAPKAGACALRTSVGFDSFNPVLTRGNPAPGRGFIYDQLDDDRVRRVMPVSGMYGHVAEAVRYPDDYAWVEYRINPDARWHDGTPITAEDVAWSLVRPPRRRARTRPSTTPDVTSAEGDRRADSPLRVQARRQTAELPHIVGQLLVRRRTGWTATGPDGQPRSITSGHPSSRRLGSGPYRIGDCRSPAASSSTRGWRTTGPPIIRPRAARTTST